MLTSIVSSNPSTSILSSSTQKRRSVTFSTDSNISSGISKKTALTAAASRSDETGMNVEAESYYGYIEDGDYIDNDDDDDEYLYYHKEKWNPNSPINPLYKSDVCHYDDDDVSLSMEDVFPTRSTGTSTTGSNSATPRRTNHHHHNNGGSSNNVNSGSCDSISITDEFTTTANSSQTSLLFLRNMKRIDLLHGTHNLNVDYDFDDLDTSSTQNDDANDDDDDDYLLPPSHHSSTIANTENDDEAQEEADYDSTNVAQPPKHSPSVDAVTSTSMTSSAKKTTTNSNKNNKNHHEEKSNVSLQDYFERSQSSILSNSHVSPRVVVTTTNNNNNKAIIQTTNESVTSSTMDNTSWNEESICSGTSQVLR